MGRVRIRLKNMKTSSKIKTFLIIFFIAIFVIIAARHFIGLHFKKKFSVRPAPGVIVSTVEKSLFYKSIETFGTANIPEEGLLEVFMTAQSPVAKVPKKFFNLNF